MKAKLSFWCDFIGHQFIIWAECFSWN